MVAREPKPHDSIHCGFIGILSDLELFSYAQHPIILFKKRNKQSSAVEREMGNSHTIMNKGNR